MQNQSTVQPAPPEHIAPDPHEQRTRCSCGFAHPPHDFCDGNPAAKFGMARYDPSPRVPTENPDQGYEVWSDLDNDGNE